MDGGLATGDYCMVLERCNDGLQLGVAVKLAEC